MNSKIAIWRAKALAGTLTEAEMAEAILALRADRVGASVASEASRKKKAGKIAPTLDADELARELEGL